VRKSPEPDPQTCSSQCYEQADLVPVIKVRTARVERGKVLGGLVSGYRRAASASEKLLVSGYARVLARDRHAAKIRAALAA
jgi:hypothetical protein